MPIYKDITDFLGFTKFRKKESIPSVRDMSKDTTFNESKVSLDSIKEKKVLYQWDAVARSRLNFSFNIKENRNLVVIGAVILLFFVLISEFWLITGIAATIFLMYVLSSSQGEVVSHRILNVGLEYNGDFYPWGKLKRFFFSTDNSATSYLCVDAVDDFPSRLFFVIKDEDKNKIKKILETYLSYLKEEPRDFSDKLYKFVSGKVSFK